MTLNAIAVELGRSVSTVSRGVRRNSGANVHRAARANRLTKVRTARLRPGKLADNPVPRGYVEAKLSLSGVAAAIISRRLRSEFPDDPAMRVSHETI